jgi:hypothetical protein
MHTTDLYVGVLLAAMFVVGIVLIFRWKRQHSKTREQWSAARRP